ncbi:MAG: DNA-binding protein [Pirellula sp.]|nr:DNA-binding protein [Pirellula sp.]
MPSRNDSTTDALNDVHSESLLLTTAEAARLSGIGERTLWRWSRSGIAPAPIKIGGSAVRYRRRDIEAWISAGCPRVDR